MEKEGGNGEKRYWQKEGDKSSRNLFLSFIAVTIVMAIIVVSLGVYTYVSWQSLKERPKLRAEEAQFEFHNATKKGANITVHLTLVNQGEENADSLRLEWLVMKKVNSSENIVFQNGGKQLSGLKSGSSKEVTFKIILPKSEYTIAYRTYEDELFTYEGRQDFFVTAEDAERGSPGAKKESEGAGAGTPMISTPIFIAILAIYSIYRWWIYDEKDR